MDKTEVIKDSKKSLKDTAGEKVVQGGQDQYRVVVSKEANSVLEDVVKSLNNGFDGTKMTRSSVANYVFMNLPKLLSDSDRKLLKAQHFDAKKALSALIKSSSELPEEIQKILRTTYGISEVSRKRSQRAADDLSTGEIVDKSAESLVAG